MYKTEFSFFYKNEIPMIVKARCNWVSPYDAGGLQLVLCDNITGEPVDISFDSGAFDELELQAIEELMNKKDEMELQFLEGGDY